MGPTALVYQSQLVTFHWAQLNSYGYVYQEVSRERVNPNKYKHINVEF